MNRLAPMTITHLLEFIKKKQVICFGLGIQGRRAALYFHIWGLDDNLVAFVDNDVSKIERENPMEYTSLDIQCIEE